MSSQSVLEKSGFSDAMECLWSENDGLSVSHRHTGIIVNSKPHYFHAWSKSCGSVFIPKQNCDKKSANLGGLGIWVSFVCERQEGNHSCLWRGNQVEYTSSRVQFVIEKGRKVDPRYRSMYCEAEKHRKQLCVIGCVGLMLLGHKDDQYHIWNEQLGKVIVYKCNITTSTQPLTLVLFDAKPMRYPSNEIGWEATRVYSMPEGTPIPHWSYREIECRLLKVAIGNTYAFLCNIDNIDDTIFASCKDYYMPSRSFNAQMTSYDRFLVLAVPSMQQIEHKTKWKAIYSGPKEEKPNGFGPATVKETFEKADDPKDGNQNKFSCTNDMGVMELFHIITDKSDLRLFDVMKKHSRQLIQPMLLCMLRMWDESPDIVQSVDCVEKQLTIYSAKGSRKSQRTIQTQTSICIEQTLIYGMLENNKLINEWRKIEPKFVDKLSHCFDL